MLPYFKLLVIFCAFSFALGCATHTDTKYEQLKQENSELLTQLDSLTMYVDSITHLHTGTLAPATKADLLTESDIDFLKRKGLADPVETIKADLLRNAQLISVKGSMGGTMQFYKNKVYVLNRQWVLAYFEDGHMAGEMLLEYNVENRSMISWKVLRERML